MVCVMVCVCEGVCVMVCVCVLWAFTVNLILIFYFRLCVVFSAAGQIACAPG